MPAKEKDKIKMFGILPSQDADPIPVRLAGESAGAGLIEKNEITMIGVLPSQGADPILVEFTNIDDFLENPPTEDEAGKAPTSEWAFDHDDDVDAHHARYTDGEAESVADAQILTHKNIATAHQDAPQLILDHKGDTSAHHSKYTDVNARASINNIFGSDGKADSDINLDSHSLTTVNLFQGYNHYLGVINIGDNAAEYVTAISACGIICINSRFPLYSELNAMIVFRADADVQSVILCQSHNFIEVRTGVLTGTTGTDGKVTVSPNTDGKIYIENRYGRAVSLGLTFLGT